MKKLSWPRYPIVELNDSEIYIVFEDGTSQIWGMEDDPDERELIINDIQEGLRAINYLYIALKRMLNDVNPILVNKGFSKDSIAEYQRDAIMKLMYEKRIHVKNEQKLETQQSSLFYIQ